ncbi:uncharacterized protein C18orf19 homolog A-like [Brachionichthys hirsutus]|uniref:uncharacterized protein C18orf19 homolog A-like n=1 Tax=Brachionichthys hirsutus TaxID=412623 RepID=UPI0036051528
MILQRVLSPGTMWQGAAMRPLLMGFTASEPPVPSRCRALRLSVPPSTRQRRLTTSASCRAAHQQEPKSGAEPQEGDPGAEAAVEVDPLQDKTIGLVQRFKKTFKQYWKVLVPVHLLTSSIWCGTFYYAAMRGVNVVPFLEMIGLPDSVLVLLRDSSGGYALTTYAMYKIATPARYTVTLGGTSLTVQYLRKRGYLTTPPLVKEYIQDKMVETKEKLTEKMEETKGRLSEKMEETKDKFSERLQETKERVSEGKAFFRKKND